MSSENEWRVEIGRRGRQSGSEWRRLKAAAARTAKWLTIALLGLTFAGAAGAQSLPTQEEKQTLAPTGNLRAALYLGGPTNVIKDPVSGEMKGVGYDLGKELARRMGVPYEPVIYQTPKLLVEDVNSGKWDVAFVAQDSDREKIMNFTGVYLSLEHGYLVPSGSTIKTINDVDRHGIRVGVPAGGTRHEG